MLEVTPSLVIEDAELEERFVRASGPGGQNVNKVATAVELRFNAAASPSISPLNRCIPPARVRRGSWSPRLNGSSCISVISNVPAALGMPASFRWQHAAGAVAGS